MSSPDSLARMRSTARAAGIAGAFLALLVTGASAAAAQSKSVNPPETTATSAAGPQIAIENFEFNPSTLTVPVGTTVTWISHDDEPHTVTSSENIFASAGLDADETFSHTFSTPGTYTYYCKLHPHMTGTIIVK